MPHATNERHRTISESQFSAFTMRVPISSSGCCNLCVSLVMSLDLSAVKKLLVPVILALRRLRQNYHELARLGCIAVCLWFQVPANQRGLFSGGDHFSHPQNSPVVRSSLSKAEAPLVSPSRVNMSIGFTVVQALVREPC